MGKLKTILILLLVAENVFSQSIKGKIVNENNEPVPFANVGLVDSRVHTVSDADGEFELAVKKNGKELLRIQAFGVPERIDTVTVEGLTTITLRIGTGSTSLEEVVVGATRVEDRSGMAYSNLKAEEIRKANFGQDAPYVMNTLPNVVVNSDAGNGVGYTGLRIRGSDATRINVTINGVPVNDAESQGTFWVDMPDLLSSTGNIQVQRGVGASSNGSGAFGATINFRTNQVNEKPYVSLVSTAGSYATFRNSLSAGTGLMNKKWTVDLRASAIGSQGYIDRASSSLASYYGALGYYGKKYLVRFINFSGWEKTYQAWNYVPEDSLLAGNRTYNSCGEYVDQDGVTRYYRNETDNYYQNNSQLHFISQFNSRTTLNITAHYTKGKGYYEQYRQGDTFEEYGLPPFVTGSGGVINGSDMVRRLWLDNDFAGGLFNITNRRSQTLDFVLGGGYSSYFGKHFGQLVQTSDDTYGKIDRRFGMNSGNKNDANIYLKTNYHPLRKLNVFVDLQLRAVSYRFAGLNDLFTEIQQQADYSFFNPKFGVSYDLGSNLNIYGSFAMASKEPNRDDFIQSTPSSRPMPEELKDTEAGLRYTRKKVSASLNFYNMQYTNQLVLNGQINNVGAYNRINVNSSYRRGLEAELSLDLNKMFRISGNVSVSENKILDYVQYIDSGDIQLAKTYGRTDISFSPGLVAAGILTFRPLKGLEISLIQKYVGRQYLDNTSTAAKSLDPYKVLDLRANYAFRFRKGPELGLMLGLFNLLGEIYATNGYTDGGRYYGSTFYTYNAYAPAAPFNFMGGLSLKL